MATIQSVSRPNANIDPNPWLAALAGAIGGGAGQIAMGQQRQDASQDQRQKALLQLAVANAQQGRNLLPGQDLQGDPFSLQFGAAPGNNPQNDLREAQTYKINLDTGRTPMNPTYARYKAISDVDTAIYKNPIMMYSMTPEKRAQMIEQRTQDLLGNAPEPVAVNTPDPSAAGQFSGPIPGQKEDIARWNTPKQPVDLPSYFGGSASADQTLGVPLTPRHNDILQKGADQFHQRIGKQRAAMEYQAAHNNGKILVKNKITGVIGHLPKDKWNPAKYEFIE